MTQCDKLVVFPQISGTCWFNALLMALFFSENTRNMFIQKESSWAMSMKLRKVFRDILKRRAKTYDEKDYAYLFFKVITPEYILEQLHKEDASKFKFDPTKRLGYFNTMYLPNLLEFLGVSDKLHLDAVDNKDGTCTLYYSNLYNDYNIKTVAHHDKKAPKYAINYTDEKKIKMPKKKEYDVITVRFSKELHSNANLFQKNVKIDEVLKVAGTSYVNDSLLLTNFNISTCGKGHDIAGVTCAGKRYMYNGWMRKTQDRGMAGVGNKYPCELMEYDWLNFGDNFCLNPKLCKLDGISTEDLTKQICFNAKAGERTYILVNTKYERVAKPTSAAEHAPVGTGEGAPDGKKPASPGRGDKRVTKSASIAKPIKERTKSASSRATKSCPEGKIVNPASGRCVKIDGKIGRKLSQAKV
jgi:hypothetical protein